MSGVAARITDLRGRTCGSSLKFPFLFIHGDEVKLEKFEAHSGQFFHIKLFVGNFVSEEFSDLSEI